MKQSARGQLASSNTYKKESANSGKERNAKGIQTDTFLLHFEDQVFRFYLGLKGAMLTKGLGKMRASGGL
jgi:hypothetical protein